MREGSSAYVIVTLRSIVSKNLSRNLFSQMLMNAWWRMVGVQRCATTLREVSSAAAFYQAMRSQTTVPAVLVCTIAELPEFSCVSISAVIR